MTLEEIADRSTEINRNMRIALHELLEIAEGSAQTTRDIMVPKIKDALEKSKDMPTAFDVVNALGGLSRHGK